MFVGWRNIFPHKNMPENRVFPHVHGILLCQPINYTPEIKIYGKNEKRI